MSIRITIVDTGGHQEIRVEYDGRQPPLELFSAWAGLGWRPPTPEMPPRTAIDWSAPDPDTGRPFSLRSWEATGTATLERHSRDDPRRVAGALDAARRLGYDVGDPAPEPASGARSRISAVVLAHAAPALIAGARSRGATVETREVSITRSVRYRGQTTVTETPAVEVEIDITESEVDAVVSAITPYATTPPQVTPTTSTGV